MKKSLVFFILSIIVHLSYAAYAQADFNPPAILKDWESWVSWDEEIEDCPFAYDALDMAFCLGVQEMQMDMQNKKGRFSGVWINYGNERDIALPGGNDHWPLNVKINGAPAIVMQRDEKAIVHIDDKGRYSISGEFAWDSLPDSLEIPFDIGKIDLIVNEKSVKKPLIEDNVLYLKEQEDVSEDDTQDSIEITVFRKITTSVPLKIDNLLKINVSGKTREFLLPDPVLSNFHVLDVDTSLAHKMNAQGQITLQLTPGEHWMHLYSTASQPIYDVIKVELSDPYIKDELWVVEQDDKGRLMNAKDSYPIDTTHTSLPDEWKKFPAYRIDSQNSGLHFSAISDDEVTKRHSDLALHREFWLDFDGNGVTVQDRITGLSIDHWRMNALPGLSPGKVEINGESQLLTQDTASESKGFEISKGNVNALINSRMLNDKGKFSVSGWNDNFNSVSMRWHLPVGWKAIFVSGADIVNTTWIQQWTLVDIFLIVVISVAITKLLSVEWGMLSFVSNSLLWHEIGSPHELWLVLIGIIALLTYMPSTKIKVVSLLVILRRIVLIFLWVQVVGFSIDHIRYAIYPQLEPGNYSYNYNSSYAGKDAEEPTSMIEGKMYKEELAKGEKLAEQMNAMEDRGVVMPAAPTVQYESVLSSVGSEVRKSKKIIKHDMFFEKDKDSNIQTGPGIPEWIGSFVDLRWTSMVDPDQTGSIVLLSPVEMRIIHILQVLLLLAMSMKLSQFKIKLPKEMPKWLFVILAIFVTNVDAIEMPTQDLLNAYHDKLVSAKRLSKLHQCLPQCAQIEQGEVQINNEQISWNLTVHAQEKVAIPLPMASNFEFRKIMMDGGNQAIFFHDDKAVYILIDKGVHHVQLLGNLDAQNEVSWIIPMTMHYMKFNESLEWQIEGIHEDGQVDNQLTLTRTVKKQVMDSFQQSFEASPFLRVERKFEFGLDWRLVTHIHRESAANTAIMIDIPLLENEQVTSQGFHFKEKDGKQWITVNLAPDMLDAEWDSNIVKTEKIELQSLATDQWYEVWDIKFSPLWHVEYEKNNVTQILDSEWYPQWKPYSGEKVILKVTKPKAIDGATLTLNSAKVVIASGNRNLDAELTITAQSSKGGEHVIQLPTGVKIRELQVNGQQKPIHQMSKENGKPVDLVLPIVAGLQNFKINFSLPQNDNFRWSLPKINFNTVVTNLTTDVRLSDQQWVLYLTGPVLGPALLFWGMIVGLFCISYGLSRIGFMSFKWHEWLLLLVGLTQNSLEGLFFIVFVLLAIGIRGSAYWKIENRIVFNSMQILFVFILFAAGGFFVENIGQGLLGSPQMNISGLNSSSSELSWYQDRVINIPDDICIYSVHIYVYRIIMLLWSLWVANILIKKSKWVAACLSSQAFWLNSAKIESMSDQLDSDQDLKINFKK